MRSSRVRDPSAGALHLVRAAVQILEVPNRGPRSARALFSAHAGSVSRNITATQAGGRISRHVAPQLYGRRQSPVSVAQLRVTFPHAGAGDSRVTRRGLKASL